MRPSTTTFDESSYRARSAQQVRRPHLFLLLECDRPAALSARCCLSRADEVRLGRGAGRSLRRDRSSGRCVLSVEVPDGWMSREHARLEQTEEGWAVVDCGSRNGTRVNGRPVERAVLSDGDLLEVGHTVFLFRARLPTYPDVIEDVDAEELQPLSPGLETLLPSLAREFSQLGRIATTGIEVLILGESGTGKELVARAVHELSGRSGGFVPVNCGALAPQLVESELFGNEKGAFTGADQARRGLIRSADGGTLFLDEIGELPVAAQAALLRVLQEKEVLPVGGNRAVAADLRLIAATNRELEQSVESGDFREDLLARISGLVVRLPPLRERLEDLGLLCGKLLARQAREGEDVPRLSCEALRALFHQSWPRNVRELEKSLSVGAALAEGGRIELEHLPESVRGGDGAAGGAAPAELTPREEERRDRLQALLREHEGNVSAVARAMGKGRTQIQRWIQRYQIDVDSYRP